MDVILSNKSVSLTELKRSFSDILKKPMAYLEGLEDTQLVKERSEGPFIKVSLDDL